MPIGLSILFSIFIYSHKKDKLQRLFLFIEPLFNSVKNKLLSTMMADQKGKGPLRGQGPGIKNNSADKKQIRWCAGEDTQEGFNECFNRIAN